MKRIFVLILSLFYLATATGATVEMHYCMGKSIGANLVHKQKDKCRKCGMKNNLTKGCCKDEHKTFKTNDHQVTKATFDVGTTTAAIVPVAHYGIAHRQAATSLPLVISRLYPPPLERQSCPIYIVFRNIRV